MRRIEHEMMKRVLVVGLAALLAGMASQPSAWACCLFSKKSSRTDAQSQTYAMGKHPRQKAQATYQCTKCKMTFEKPGTCPMCKLKLEKVTSKSPNPS